MASKPTCQFPLRIEAVEGDLGGAEAVEQFALELRAELADLPVTRIDQLSAGEPPEGARAVEIVAAVEFLMTAVQAAAALPDVLKVIRQVVARFARRRQPVRLTVAGHTIDPVRSSDAELGQVVDTLLALPALPAVGARRALVVANSHYDDPRLAQLRSPGHDAEALARVLGDPGIGGFSVEQLVDADERTIRRQIAALFSESDRDDVLLLHFSCHGVKDARGRLFLAARDTDLSVLGATAIPASLVNDLLSEAQSRRVVLILDCCYSGAFARGGAAVRAGSEVQIADEFGAGSGRIVLTASSATEYAFEGGELTQDVGRPSAFTGALVQGLQTGEADLDADGDISIDELYDYTYRTVRERTPGQAPMKWSFGVEGSLVVARSVRPAALPQPIADDLASDRVVLRLEAVRALEAILRSGKAGLRTAALATLARTRDHDDSLRVQRAATAALAAAGVAPVSAVAKPAAPTLSPPQPSPLLSKPAPPPQPAAQPAPPSPPADEPVEHEPAPVAPVPVASKPVAPGPAIEPKSVAPKPEPAATKTEPGPETEPRPEPVATVSTTPKREPVAPPPSPEPAAAARRWPGDLAPPSTRRAAGATRPRAVAWARRWRWPLVATAIVAVAVAVTVAVLTGGDTAETSSERSAGAGGGSAGPPLIAVGASDDRLFEAKGNALAVYDPEAGSTPSATISLPDNVAAIAAAPDGNSVYLALGSLGRVIHYDVTAKAIVGQPVVVGNQPTDLTVNQDGSRLYVANSGSGSVSVIETATMTLLNTIQVGGTLEGIAISSVGKAYVALGVRAGAVAVIDLATGRPRLIALDGGSSAVVSTPDGTRVYVASYRDGSISAIDTGTDAIVSTVRNPGFGPSGLAASPDGSRVYVANQAVNTVTLLDTAGSRSVMNWLGHIGPVGNGPTQLAVNKDGSRLYIAHSGGVTVVDTVKVDIVTTAHP